MASLQFKDALSWRAGKAISIADLSRRLQTLAAELKDMEQEEIDRPSFVKVSNELASANLLAHKDRGIQAWTACCIVDILRISAPDAPFTGRQLRDIFNAITTRILPCLADTKDAYHPQHLYILTSLATVKSIVLMTDIDDADKLLRNLFASFFDMIAHATTSSTTDPLSKVVEINFTAILIILIDESAVLPIEVVDTIMAQFFRVDPVIVASTNKKAAGKAQASDSRQSTLDTKDVSPSYNVAKTICNSCAGKMSRQISQYFNDIILDASASVSNKLSLKTRHSNSDFDNSEVDVSLGPTEEDLKDLRRAHQLLRELWRACPNVLSNVIPQLEAELSAENVHLRLLATETFGDIISGIGAAGPPDFFTPNPTQFPYSSLQKVQESFDTKNFFKKPSSPQSFPQSYPGPYSNFMGRCHDKSPIIRAAWATGICRILTTSAGGIGLQIQEEERLLEELPRSLGDVDERVRIAAVKGIGTFTLGDAVRRLGGDEQGRLIFNALTQRVRDRKPLVRSAAMHVLAKLWGAAVGELAAGDVQVTSTLGSIPSCILATYMTNDLDIHLLLDQVIFEDLLPLGFPTQTAKFSKTAQEGNRPDAKGVKSGDLPVEGDDLDQVRAERILILVNSLDEKARKVFYAMQQRQSTLTGYITMYLRRCEDFNGGVMEKDDKEIKNHLTRLIENLSRAFPDSLKFSDQLWKFAKLHDRRAYQLIRFAMAPESDYKTVFKAIREFRKRIEQTGNSSIELLNSMIPLLYRVSALVYNRSHVPSILKESKTEGGSLNTVSHEILRDISSRRPEVLKARIREICQSVQDDAPSENRKNGPAAVDNLKACVSIAARFGSDLPKDRKFMQALFSFATFGAPAEAAKHAVTVIMAISDKKELMARDLVVKCVEQLDYESVGFLPRLAALSQLVILAPDQAVQHADAISEIAIEKILMQSRNPSKPSDQGYIWQPEVDVECDAKCWALRILVNQVRSLKVSDSTGTLADKARPVYAVLAKLITAHGELLHKRDTNAAHKPRLRLLAARSYLKLCTTRETDALLLPSMFNDLAIVAQDEHLPVRTRFLHRLKKYINLGRLAQRFWTIPFLLAWEPYEPLRFDTQRWIRNRSHLRAEAAKSGNDALSSGRTSIVMESVFARFLSLLAHHPDFASTSDDLKDFANYILFYLASVATEDNISLIFHIAQRVKQCRDAIVDSSSMINQMDENLHHLSDLAQLTIRKYEEARNWTIQTQPGRASLPKSLFSEIRDHGMAVRIAERNYMPQDMDEKIEDLVKVYLKPTARHANTGASSSGNATSSRKRKGENGQSERVKSKKVRRDRDSSEVMGSSSPQTRKKRPSNASKAKGKKRKSDDMDEDAHVPFSSSTAGHADEADNNKNRRRSGRTAQTRKYLGERNDSEDDAEMQDNTSVPADSPSPSASPSRSPSPEAEAEAEVEAVTAPTPSKSLHSPLRLRSTPSSQPTKTARPHATTTRSNAKSKGNAKPGAKATEKTKSSQGKTKVALPTRSSRRTATAST